ncbi:MAG: ThiF family adenylyltransferase [Acidobacteriota bacterium]
MTKEYIDVSGEVINITDLQIPKAIDTAITVQRLDFVNLIECRREPDSGNEFVIIDIEPELGQVNVNDIRKTERIAILFDSKDQISPEALALRRDFPQVPHLVLKTTEFPRSLCLYDERYEDQKLSWTSSKLINRISEWLSQTSRGALHGEDQPLEPLLPGTKQYLVLPSELFNGQNTSDYELMNVRQANNVLITSVSDPKENADMVAIAIVGEAQTHGVIRREPANLKELHDFLESANIELINDLRSRFTNWYSQSKYQEIISLNLIIVIILPKKRTPSQPIEDVEIVAFVTSGNVQQVGEEIGVWSTTDGTLGLHWRPDTEQMGDKIFLDILQPMSHLSKEMAAKLSGNEIGFDLKIVAVGMGALGSQVTMNLVRMGFGEWDLIDYDQLLPHNLARHALPFSAIGYPKVNALSVIANQTVPDIIKSYIVADILNPLSQEERINETLNQTDVIIDFSASVSVARHLAIGVEGRGRRISVFLNPSGSDSVVLIEDDARDHRLDHLEMMYYRALINDSSLQDHLSISDRLRYSNACRDVSSRLPQDYVAIHAGICSRFIRIKSIKTEACINLFRIIDETMDIKSIPIPITIMKEIQFGEWSLCYDELLIEKVNGLRNDKLPNETGGILVGSIDMQRKILYVIDVEPSPPDSKEWPFCYIRGCVGLQKRMLEVSELTAGMCFYVGEWHSHPKGHRAFPSSDDYKAFQWQKELLSRDGQPPIMLIVGEEYKWYVDKMNI